MKRRLLVINLFAFVLSIAVFTPFLMPKNAGPTTLMGLPYALFMVIAVTIVFIILTWQTSVAYKKVEEEE